MLRSLMTAASGMKAQQMQVDTIANNLANVNTAGFKRSRLTFKSLLYQTLKEPGAPTANGLQDATGLQIGSGTQVSGSQKIFGQGVLELTNGMYDLSIEGEGFFRVRTPGGEFVYTRSGDFRRDSDGRIVTADGYTLDPAITVAQDVVNVTIGRDGTVTAFISEEDLGSEIGTLQLFRFANPAGLKAQGGNYYTETPSSGPATQQQPGLDGTGEIVQGALERSNVETVEELVALIVAQRNYEVNSRAIRVSDEMLQQVNQLIR
jgi:flagellar basal-body rod protein FlgG